MKKLRMLITGLCLLMPLIVIAETGSALKNDTLRKEPFTDAKSAGSMTRGESVQILKKQGAWLQIKTKKPQAGYACYLSNAVPQVEAIRQQVCWQLPAAEPVLGKWSPQQACEA